MTTTDTAKKAFAVLEAIGTLESALWELFYDEFITLCELKSADLYDNNEDNLNMF